MVTDMPQTALNVSPDALTAPPTAAGPVLTADEAAAQMRVTATKVRAMCASGELPAVQVGRQWRIRQAEVDRLLTPADRPRPSAEQVAERTGLSPRSRLARTAGRVAAHHREVDARMAGAEATAQAARRATFPDAPRLPTAKPGP